MSCHPLFLDRRENRLVSWTIYTARQTQNASISLAAIRDSHTGATRGYFNIMTTNALRARELPLDHLLEAAIPAPSEIVVAAFPELYGLAPAPTALLRWVDNERWFTCLHCATSTPAPDAVARRFCTVCGIIHDRAHCRDL